MKLDQVIKLMEIYGECHICKNNLIGCKKDDFIENNIRTRQLLQVGNE